MAGFAMTTRHKEKQMQSYQPDEYIPHSGGQEYIFRLAYNRLSEEESTKARGRWTKYCLCGRPLTARKVVKVHKGLHYGLFEWQSVCYACGLPPEICSCPKMHNGMGRKLSRCLCEPSFHWQKEGQLITQTTFERFGGTPGPEETWEDTRTAPQRVMTTDYPTLPEESFPQ